MERMKWEEGEQIDQLLLISISSSLLTRLPLAYPSPYTGDILATTE